MSLAGAHNPKRAYERMKVTRPELWTLVIGYFWKWRQPTDYLIICQQTTDCRLSPWLCANDKRQFVPRDHVLILQVVWFLMCFYTGGSQWGKSSANKLENSTLSRHYKTFNFAYIWKSFEILKAKGPEDNLQDTKVDILYCTIYRNKYLLKLLD